MSSTLESLYKVQKDVKRVLNGISSNSDVKSLRKKLEKKLKSCKPKSSIKNTFIKLFNLIDHEVNIHLKYIKFRYANMRGNLYVTDKRKKIIYSNLINITKKTTISNNIKESADFAYQRYVSGNSDLPYYYQTEDIKNNDSGEWVDDSKDNLSLFSTKNDPEGAISSSLLSELKLNVKNEIGFLTFSGNNNLNFENPEGIVPDGYNSVIFNFCGSGGKLLISDNVDNLGGGSGAYTQFTIGSTVTDLSSGSTYILTNIVAKINDDALKSYGTLASSCEFTYTSNNGTKLRSVYYAGNGNGNLGGICHQSLSNPTIIPSNLVQVNGVSGGDSTETNGKASTGNWGYGYHCQSNDQLLPFYTSSSAKPGVLAISPPCTDMTIYSPKGQQISSELISRGSYTDNIQGDDGIQFEKLWYHPVKGYGAGSFSINDKSPESVGIIGIYCIE